MRKINTTKVLNPSSYEPAIAIYVINEDGSKEQFLANDHQQYTPAQMHLINRINTTFTKNGKPVLSEEEINYLLRSDELVEPNEEELQKLAGFTVEKKIIYNDK